MKDKGATLHVLLVDDEQEFLSAAASALRRRGFVVSTATGGDGALRHLQQEIIDVVVLDVKMPGLSGDELFLVLKRRWPDVPVVMLTGHGTIGHAFTSSREGVVAYLSKPCDIERLVEVLRRAVRERRALLEGPSESEGGGAIRVLVIDDEQELLDVLSPTLSRRGLRVATARTGARAFEQLAQQEFDVVLLDLKLQGEHGLDLLVEIKRSHPSVEVIIHTGHPSADSAVDGLKRGAFDYLSKPTDMKALLAKIQAAYRLRQRRNQERQDQRVREILEERPD